MRRTLAKADENDMTISAYTRLEQMRAEIEAVHKIAVQTQARSKEAISNADHILQSNDNNNDTVIDRLNDLIEQAITRPN